MCGFKLHAIKISIFFIVLIFSRLKKLRALAQLCSMYWRHPNTNTKL
jgi:hypothetical protein